MRNDNQRHQRRTVTVKHRYLIGGERTRKVLVLRDVYACIECGFRRSYPLKRLQPKAGGVSETEERIIPDVCIHCGHTGFRYRDRYLFPEEVEDIKLDCDRVTGLGDVETRP